MIRIGIHGTVHGMVLAGTTRGTIHGMVHGMILTGDTMAIMATMTHSIITPTGADRITLPVVAADITPTIWQTALAEHLQEQPTMPAAHETVHTISEAIRQEAIIMP